MPWLFSICDCHLSVRMERPVNEHRVPSNRETLSWFKNNLKNGKASEEMFKTEASMASIGLVRGTLTLWWKDLRLLKEECFIPSQGSQRQRGLSNCFYLRWGVLLKGDLPIVFSCSATLTVQAGFPWKWGHLSSQGSGQLLMNITSHMNICEKKVKVYVYIFLNCRQNDAIKIKSKKKVELHISRLNT